MGRTIVVETTVLPGGRIEISKAELPEGATATVQITISDEERRKRPLREVLGNYPGGRLFRTAEEVDAYLHEERESWDR
jgi:hypothetical protein